MYCLVWDKRDLYHGGAHASYRVVFSSLERAGQVLSLNRRRGWSGGMYVPMYVSYT